MATAAIGHRRRLTLRLTFVVRAVALAVVVVASVLLALAVAGAHPGSVVPAPPAAERSASSAIPAVAPEPYPTLAS